MPEAPSGLVYFPYLPLNGPVAVGEWRIVPRSEFDGPWPSARFESLAVRFMAAFVGVDRQPTLAGAVLVRGDGACDGTIPSPDQRLALQRAVELASLDANPVWTDRAQAWKVLTSDNAELQAWPIDLAGGAVTPVSGLVVRTMHGGLSIDEGLIIPAPEELHLPLVTIRLDDDVVDAAFRHFQLGEVESDNQMRRRLRGAAAWLSKAWRNTPSVDWPERIIYLKTGFESLTGESSTPAAARALRELFERATADDVQDVATKPLLWDPSETPRHPYRDGRGRDHTVTDLEHWFLAFGSARNSIIHGDSPGALVYLEIGSAYNGPLFHTAERLLRDAIKVAISERGETHLYSSRQVRRAARRLAPASPDGAGPTARVSR